MVGAQTIAGNILHRRSSGFDSRCADVHRDRANAQRGEGASTHWQRPETNVGQESSLCKEGLDYLALSHCQKL